MTFAAVLSVVKKLCTTIAAVGMSLVAAQTAGQIKLSPQVFSIISLVAIVAGLVSRSVIPEPAPGPFPMRTSGGPGDRVALLLFAGLAAASSALLLSCATTSGPLGAAEVCGEKAMFSAVSRVYPALLDDLAKDDWTTAPATLEAQIGPTGADVVTCALQYAVAEAQSRSAPSFGQSLAPADDPARWRTIHDRAQKLLDQRATSIPMPASAHVVRASLWLRTQHAWRVLA